MPGHQQILGRMLRDKLIAVIRMDDPVRAAEAIEAIAAGGISIIEITLTTPGALELIAAFAGRDGLLVGAGTVLAAGDADEVFAAGAGFFASPVFDPAIIAIARDAGRVAMPGAYTPTEIFAAWRAGADIIKIFPMPAPGASYIASLLGPLPGLRLAPSGGVTESTARTLLQSGAVALNVGSWLTHEADGTPASAGDISRRAARLMAAAYN